LFRGRTPTQPMADANAVRAGLRPQWSPSILTPDGRRAVRAGNRLRPNRSLLRQSLLTSQIQLARRRRSRRTTRSPRRTGPQADRAAVAQERLRRKKERRRTQPQLLTRSSRRVSRPGSPTGPRQSPRRLPSRRRGRGPAAAHGPCSALNESNKQPRPLWGARMSIPP